MRNEVLSLEAMLVSRAYLYTAFHKAFGGSPSAELLSVLAGAETHNAVDEYASNDETMAKLRDFLSRLDTENEAFLWNVEAEYARMFIGPGGLIALPWESPYLTSEALLMQESTLAVREAYKACGLQIAQLHKVPDDHVSTMCAFMGTMSDRSLIAFREGRWLALRDLMLGQCAFVRDHMSNWLPRYASKACSGKTAHLYPQLAKGIAAFVELDKVFAAEVVAWVGDMDDSAALEGYDRPASFAAVEEAYEKLKAIRLFGLEENELREV